MIGELYNSAIGAKNVSSRNALGQHPRDLMRRDRADDVRGVEPGAVAQFHSRRASIFEFDRFDGARVATVPPLRSIMPAARVQ